MPRCSAGLVLKSHAWILGNLPWTLKLRNTTRRLALGVFPHYRGPYSTQDSRFPNFKLGFGGAGLSFWAGTFPALRSFKLLTQGRQQTRDNMKKVRSSLLLCALALSLARVPVCGADSPTLVVPSVPATTLSGSLGQAQGVSTASVSTSTTARSGVAKSAPASSSSTGSSDGPPLASSGLTLSDEIQNLIAAANKARDAFLKQQEALRHSLTTASGDLRDQIRAELEQNRDNFLAQQQEARQELRAKLAELKNQLHEHQDLIDAALSHANSTVSHARKGGG